MEYSVNNASKNCAYTTHSIKQAALDRKSQPARGFVREVKTVHRLKIREILQEIVIKKKY